MCVLSADHTHKPCEISSSSKSRTGSIVTNALHVCSMSRAAAAPHHTHASQQFTHHKLHINSPALGPCCVRPELG